jgi:hypothetical protein
LNGGASLGFFVFPFFLLFFLFLEGGMKRYTCSKDSITLDDEDDQTAVSLQSLTQLGLSVRRAFSAFGVKRWVECYFFCLRASVICESILDPSLILF